MNIFCWLEFARLIHQYQHRTLMELCRLSWLWRVGRRHLGECLQRSIPEEGAKNHNRINDNRKNDNRINDNRSKIRIRIWVEKSKIRIPHQSELEVTDINKLNLQCLLNGRKDFQTNSDSEEIIQCLLRMQNYFIMKENRTTRLQRILVNKWMNVDVVLCSNRWWYDCMSIINHLFHRSYGHRSTTKFVNLIPFSLDLRQIKEWSRN